MVILNIKNCYFGWCSSVGIMAKAVQCYEIASRASILSIPARAAR